MPVADDGDQPSGDVVRSMRDRLGRSVAGADASKRVTLTGTVEQGVEGSVVLLGGAGSPLAELMGRPRADYRLGARLRVTGRFVSGLASAAQQGRPFEVETVEPV